MKHKSKSYYLIKSLKFIKPYLHYSVIALIASILSKSIAIFIPLLIKDIIDNGVITGGLNIIITGVSVILALSLVDALFNYLTGSLTEKTSQSVAYDIRNKIHEKVHKMSFSYHDQTESGQILTRVIKDVDIIRTLTGRAFIRIFEMFFLVSGILIVMFLKLNPYVSLCILILIPIIAANAYKFGTKYKPMSFKIREAEEKLTTNLEQNLRASRIVKAFGQEKEEIKKFKKFNNDLLTLELKTEKMKANFIPLLSYFINIATALIVIVGGVFAIKSSLKIGEIVAFIAYIVQLQVPLRRFGMMMGFIVQASSSGERIFEILDLELDIKEKEKAIDLINVKGNIDFKNVTFSYPDNSYAIENVNFTINPGATAAILGITGSGKTSIINLIPRFYDPTDGEVLIDNINIKNLTLNSLRKNIGIVLQETVLFASTIKENITFGVDKFTDNEIINACKTAYAHDFIMTFPDGYETKVGEKGITLSGGQKQRIAIARALLKDPKILILDDATSSVDTETEHLIQKALKKLMKNRTSIIIAQRLSTIRNADMVIIMNNGKIENTAYKKSDLTCHDILIKTSEIYKDIFYNQLKR